MGLDSHLQGFSEKSCSSRIGDPAIRMDSNKKIKSMAMIDSNSDSDSDLSDSEFKNLAKKPKLDETDQAIKSASASPKKSSSSSSSSSSSGSGDEWDGDGDSPRKKKLTKKKGDKR